MVHMDLRLLAKLYDIVKLNKNEAPVVLAENFTSTGDSFNYGSTMTQTNAKINRKEA